MESRELIKVSRDGIMVLMIKIPMSTTCVC